MSAYENIGVMLDMSRNGVMKVSEVKRFIDYLSKMGYNALELYTEDTFVLEGEPFFGYLRGGYTAEEIKEIDLYALDKGVELIPCIQTLAHFTNTRKIPRFQELFDIDDILMIGEEKTYEFLEKIFQTLAKNFTSRKVNIGMDEADNVGLGKYLREHDYKNRSELLVQHLNRVSEIAEKYGFTCHMWSDMFFRLISGGGYFAEDLKDIHVSPEIAAKVPNNVALTYWTYYTTEKEKYDMMFDKHLEFGREVWFAGGTVSWQGFAPLNGYSLRTLRPAMESVREKGVKNVLICVWGDNGKECSYFSILPSLFATRQFADGVYDMDVIKVKFKELFAIDFDQFMALDLPNEFYIDGVKNIEWNCLCATMTYNDCFLGIKDADYAKFDKIDYQGYAKTLAEYAKTAGEFSYLFETLSCLCSYLEYKAEIGLKTRKFYKEKDFPKLKGMVEYYHETVRRLDNFTKALKKQWMKECKPFGWEIQEIRLGGMRARLLGSAERLALYLNGELEKIEELEVEILHYGDRNGFMYHRYLEAISPSEL